MRGIVGNEARTGLKPGLALTLIPLDGESGSGSRLRAWKVFFNQRVFSRKILVLMAVIVSSQMILPFAGLATEVPDGDFPQKYQLPRDPQPLVRQILARDEYRQGTDESFIDWLKWQLWEMVRRALQWLVERFRGVEGARVNGSTVSLFVDLILLGAIALVAMVLVWVLAKRLSRLNRAGTSSGDPDTENAQEVVDSRRSRALAMSSANKGDYRGALIHLFRFVLLLLDETGKITVRPGETNREILASIGPNVPAYTLLAEMVPVFNRVRYGDSPCGKEDYDRFVGLCEKVEEGDRTS